MGEAIPVVSSGGRRMRLVALFAPHAHFRPAFPSYHNNIFEMALRASRKV